MVDIGQKIRKAYYEALTGNLVYESSVIPVVDEKLDVNITEHDIYVLMQAQNEVDRNNKSFWARECDLSMRIVNQRKATNEKEVVEDVSNQILTILFPTRTTTSLAIDAPLKLVWARLINSEYSPLIQNETGLIISKTITFKNRITQ